MSEPFVGQIGFFSFNFAPRGWSQCNGQLMQITQNQALFALLGTTYGGDGRVTFGLPDVRSRRTVAYFASGGSNNLTPYNLGQTVGTENVTLSTTQIPQHNHIPMGTTSDGASDDPTNSFWGNDSSASILQYTKTLTPAATMYPGALGTAGGNQPHSNLPPYLTVNFCIALVGIFPSRN